MSLLTLIQEFALVTGLPAISAVMGSSNPQVIQIRYLLLSEGHDLSMRGDWQALTVEEVHTTTAAEDQGAIATIASNGFRYICNETMWDRTDQLPVPLIGSQEWQRQKALSTLTPRYQYRIRQGKLLITPAIPANHSLAFEYMSRYWITDAAGTTYKSAYSVDTDLHLLPEELLLMGLRWRWKKEKGFDYAEDFRVYELQVKQYLNRDGGKSTLCMDNAVDRRYGRPGIVVPESSWSLP